MSVDASQLSPQIQRYIQDQIQAAQAAKDAANQPKVLSPREQVDAALSAVHVQEARERVAPGHNDHIVGAIVTYLDALAAYAESIAPASSVETPEESAPVVDASTASAVEATAPLAGD